MRWLVIASLVIAFAFASTPTTRLCYHCINTDRHLSPTIRRQLGNQRDIFYWSIEAVNPNCHRAGPIYSDEFEAQICPTSAPCIALSTNIASTFAYFHQKSTIFSRCQFYNSRLYDSNFASSSTGRQSTTTPDDDR